MITESSAKDILIKPELKRGIEKYKYIMQRVKVADVSSDLKFQETYRDFYQLRRFYTDEFVGRYFKLMEQNKDATDFSFKRAFEHVKHIQCTYEISFSSKLAHTLNSALPIWDSIVIKHFGIKAPGYSRDRENKIYEKYDVFRQKFYDYMCSQEGKMLITMFDDAFPDSGISDVKKIDFILWQDRS